MSRIYRVFRNAFARAPFDGEGAYRYGGRWSSPGTRLSYASEHRSLAMLEYFLHLDKDDPPSDLMLAVAEVPDDLPRQKIDPADLPANWRDAAAPPALARFGDEFVVRAEHCLLLVPSVLAPEESNLLINPSHLDFARLTMHPLQPLRYDARMFPTPGRTPVRSSSRHRAR
ncbi:MAG TPA: RES domain-containing protein [Terriglobales bacterium]|nr:RES domain-containing protein [Terriglobales bacterium]